LSRSISVTARQLLLKTMYLCVSGYNDGISCLQQGTVRFECRVFDLQGNS